MTVGQKPISKRGIVWRIVVWRTGLTSLIGELLEDLTNNLAHALQRLDGVLCALVFLLKLSDLQTHLLELRFELARLEKLSAVLGKHALPLLVGCHDDRLGSFVGGFALGIDSAEKSEAKLSRGGIRSGFGTVAVVMGVVVLLELEV